MYEGKYTQYAQDVLDGKIVVGRFIKLACQRFFSFLERDDMYFDEKSVDRVITFISRLKHFSGHVYGKPFLLEPWQKFIVASIYGFKWVKDDTRVTTKAFILMARKQGKSALASALALYHLIADGEQQAQVLNVASNREQAHLLFDMQLGMTKQLDPKKKFLKPMRDRIKFNATNSYSRCLASDAGGHDGLSASFFIGDETHTWNDDKLWSVLISSQGFRSQPLALQISTAGFNQNGFCKKYRDMCVSILEGNTIDDTQFSAIYELDEGDDWKDPQVWIKANPNLGVTISEKYLQEQVVSATNNASLEVGVRTKNFNQWVSSSSVWLNSDIIERYSKPLQLSDFNSNDLCYCGVDLASVSDLTALSFMFKKDGDDKFQFITKYYLPSTCLVESPNREHYKLWKRQGFLTITEGNVTDYDYVLNDLMKANKDLYISKIGYDAYNSTSWAISATNNGLPIEPYSQALWSFNKPTKEFERLLKMGKVVIDNNPITKWCFENVALKYDHNDNVKPIKGSDESHKIDGVISMVESLGMYLNSPQYQNEVFAL